MCMHISTLPNMSIPGYNLINKKNCLLKKKLKMYFFFKMFILFYKIKNFYVLSTLFYIL